MALPPLTIQYADYAAWQRERVSGDYLAQQTAYWRDALAGVPEAIALPWDRARPASSEYRGGSIAFTIPLDVTSGLREVSRSQHATLFMTLQASFAVLLHRLGGDEDMLIGTAVAGRGRVELEPLVGFFANTLALRHRVRGSQSFIELLAATRETVLGAFAHAEAPFEAVVEAVRPARS